MTRTAPPADTLVRVVGPDFHTGIVMTGAVCTVAPKRLKWALGMHRDDIRLKLSELGWTATIVQKHPARRGYRR